MNLGFALSLVSEWELAGVTDAVISPGSRSGPMAVALGHSTKISTHVVLDERSAGFYALGLSKVSGLPTVVLTTSGTAAANLRPSVTEAYHGGVPMIVLTADRPLEAHKFGAAQTMEQEELFSDVVLFRSSPSIPDQVNKAHWRGLASRVFHEAVSNPFGKGPVHLNLAFREPLVEDNPEITPARMLHKSWYQVHFNSSLKLFEDLASTGRGMVVAGESDQSVDSEVVAKCAQLGWPVLAGPNSGFRWASECSMGSFEAFLRSEKIRELILPAAIVLLGSDLASRTVNGFVAQAAQGGARIVRVSNAWYWRDPQNIVSDFYFGSVASFFSRLGSVGHPNAYLEKLRELDRVANQGIWDSIGKDLSDPLVAAEIFSFANASDMIFSSSSMPIRDLEWFAPLCEIQPKVYSNRGVNGIDGVVSSFHGAARAHQRKNPHGRSLLLIGDLALRHDLGSLSSISGSGLNLFICVTDNSGGGIFSFLPRPVSLEPSQYERLFATPQPGDLEAIGRGFGLYTRVIDDLTTFRAELGVFREQGGVRLIIVRSDRTENVALHQAAFDEGKRRGEVTLGVQGI
ncbi:MAG: 2-succinyl-5-enolpyruvyl-6-hydroxy-3-cyclohexene-1-carboxylic-acid synthase [Acidimicrobiaceae bacterium]|nr:2-succinyl-5-enolpyruvyl-6-hydroxy-3-cyclohexene-1-carboxylic-acid synthase [Acidimicrobiaceae bacterium]